MNVKTILPAAVAFAAGLSLGLVVHSPHHEPTPPPPKARVAAETRIRDVAAHVTRNGVSHVLRPLSARRGDAIETLNPPTKDAAPTVVRVQAVVDGVPVLLVFESPGE